MKLLQNWESSNMGKRLIIQRRGKGSGTFTAPQTGIANTAYAPLDDRQKTGFVTGEVIGLHDDSSKLGLVQEVLLEDQSHAFVIAAEGAHIGQRIQMGAGAEVAVGNVVQLGNINEGVPVFNIEKHPGDGGKFIKSPGLYGLVLAKEAGKVSIKMPSGKIMVFPTNVRATVGNVACGGRIEKPFTKAGKRHHAMLARKKRYPGVRGVAMNPSAHPYGGAQHHAGKSKSTSRNAPPGRKVGAIASSRTGRKKK